MASTLIWILILATGYSQIVSSQVSMVQLFFFAGQRERITLWVKASSLASNFKWMWSSHDGIYVNVEIASITASTWTWNQDSTIRDSFSRASQRDLYIQPNFENAGVFWFKAILPREVTQDVAVFEVISVRATPRIWIELLDLGSDWSMSCEASRLPEGATLKWTGDGGPTSNITLSYNNITHMIIHNIDQFSKGNYDCNIMLNDKSLFAISFPLNVKKDTRRQHITLFRERSNSSKVTLTCRTTPSFYSSAYWTRRTPQDIQSVLLTSSNRRTKDRFPSEVENKQFSSPAFDGHDYPLHISSLTFEDSGNFSCFIDASLVTTAKLITIKVSAIPSPDQQEVVLRCDLSEVWGSVTLTWLRMESSGRGTPAVTQKTLTLKKTLSWTVRHVNRDEQHWVCAVFTNGLLRATSSLTLTPTQSSNMTTVPDPRTGVAGDHQNTVIVVGCLSLLFAGILIAALVFYCKSNRRDREKVTTSLSLTSKSDPVYGNVTNTQRNNAANQKSLTGGEEGNEELHYSSFALGDGSGTPKPKQNDTVIYSAVNIQ